MKQETIVRYRRRGGSLRLLFDVAYRDILASNLGRSGSLNWRTLPELSKAAFPLWCRYYGVWSSYDLALWKRVLNEKASAKTVLEFLSRDIGRQAMSTLEAWMETWTP